MFRVERANRRERDGLVAEQHRPVLPQQIRRDRSNRQDRNSDHAGGLDADVRLHFQIRDNGGLVVGMGVSDRDHSDRRHSRVSLNRERERERGALFTKQLAKGNWRGLLEVRF